MTITRKKLIEVALPLDAINAASARDKGATFPGHPRRIHKWWSAKPLPAARAAILGALADDPGNSLPDDAAAKVRGQMLELLGALCTEPNNQLLERFLSLGGFDRDRPPVVTDPFAGSGAIPFEAIRLGFPAHASDVNPIATTMTRAVAQYPQACRGLGPFMALPSAAQGRSGLAADVEELSRWMESELLERLGNCYPKEHVEAWLWCRCVRCPNPGCNRLTPLASKFWLDKGRTWVDFTYRDDRPLAQIRDDAGPPPPATKSGRSIHCLWCKASISERSLYEICNAKGIVEVPVAQFRRGAAPRFAEYSASEFPTTLPAELDPSAIELPIPEDRRWFSPPAYGLTDFSMLFNTRQLAALLTLSDLVYAAYERLVSGGAPNDYALAAATYLALIVDNAAESWSSLARWRDDTLSVEGTFGMQAMGMIWDYAEINPFGPGRHSLRSHAARVVRVIEWTGQNGVEASVSQEDAKSIRLESNCLVVTDPPYYDSIGYADLSDFFYVWLRRSLSFAQLEDYSTRRAPRASEMLATKARHGSKRAANEAFERDLQEFFCRVAEAKPDWPVCVFYGYKGGAAGTDGGPGPWESLLQSLVESGLQITASWPVQTEVATRRVAIDTNSLNRTVILVCRARPADAPSATRLEFLNELAQAMRVALPLLASGQVAPVDLAQASIGPGMAAYSKFSAVLRQDGKRVTVGDALQDINDSIASYRAERTSSFDPKTRFCLELYELFGFETAPYGDVDNLARTKNVSVAALQAEHLLVAEAGRSFLVPLRSYPAGVTELDRRFAGSTWEACLRLAATLQEEGEAATAALARELGEGVCARARELAVWLYTIADARKRTQDALTFNALDASWPEIQRLMAAMDRGGQQGRFA